MGNATEKTGRRSPLRLSRRKRIVFGLTYAGILTGCAALAIAILELVAASWTTLPSDFSIRNARLNHSFPPHKEQEHDEWLEKNPEFPGPYVHTYNAQGWVEDYDVAVEKPPGVYRIFYVGDSFTEGCVPMYASVPSRVEVHLNRHFASEQTTFEVINTGTSSYSPVIYYILVRYFLREYSPDLIVVNVDMTDVFDDWKYRQTLITDKDGNPFAAPRRDIFTAGYVDTLEGTVRADWKSRMQLFLYQNSFLYNWINPVTRPSDASPARDGDVLISRWAWCQHEWSRETEEHVAFTLDVLRRLAEYCRAQRIKLMITAVPHYEQFLAPGESRPKWSSRPHRVVGQMAREQSVVFLDSRAALARFIDGTPQHAFYYRGDMHFNPRGFALWAEAHIRAITDAQNGLLPDTVYPAR